MTDLSQSFAPEPRAILAWKYILGDGKWRFQKEWSNGANMLPVFDLTPEIADALEIEQAKTLA